MNKKVILISICVVMIGASAILLFRTFFSTPAPVEVAVSPVDATAPNLGVQTVLPYGKALDFSSIDQYNVNRKQFPYPLVSSGEIGVDSLRLTK